MSDSRISFADLNDLPLDVISQLTKNEIVCYLKSLRGAHNRYKSIYESQKEKADRLSIEVAEARAACKKLKDQPNELLEALELARKALHRLSVDAEITGLDKQAGWDCFFIQAREAMAKIDAIEKARGEG